MNKIEKFGIFVTLFFLMLIIFYIFIIPVIIIWALNNLFPLDIKYTWETWLSVYILLTIINVIYKEEHYNESFKKLWR
jgi:hypothetical protein